MSDPKTAPVVSEILAKMAQIGFSTEAVESSEENMMGIGKELIEAMMAALPIKSLVSFADGALDADTLIFTFNQCLGK